VDKWLKVDIAFCGATLDHMDVLAPTLPETIEAFQQLVRDKDGVIESLSQDVVKLQGQVAWLTKQLFGRKSERFDLSGGLFDQWAQDQSPDAAQSPAPQKQQIAYTRTKPGGKREVIPEHLPRRDKVYDIPEDQKVCPQTGAPLVVIGREVSEQLEYEAPSMYVIRHIRLKYGPANGDGPVTTALKPASAIEKGLAGPGLLALVAVSKFADHQPLYRQEKILARFKVRLSRSSACRWMQELATLLAPLLALMKTRILTSKVIQADETMVKQQQPGSGGTKTCYFWCYRGDDEHPYTLYDYAQGRGGKHPRAWFDPPPDQVRFSGYLQCDDYAGYHQFFRMAASVSSSICAAMIWVACMAHARRKFHDCRMNYPGPCHHMLSLFKSLYKIERDGREQTMDLRAYRQAHAKPILDSMRDWCKAEQQKGLPSTKLGEAIGYFLSNWEGLTRYLDDADLSIDNNACESDLRGIALGRKNWQFTGSPAGGEAAAAMFGLIATCRRHDVNPFAYLRDLFDRFAQTPISQIDQFLPDRWIAEHPEAVVKKR
jgi:transposase